MNLRKEHNSSANIPVVWKDYHPLITKITIMLNNQLFPPFNYLSVIKNLIIPVTFRIQCHHPILFKPFPNAA